MAGPARAGRAPGGAGQLVVLAALIAGLTAALGPAAPTGHPVTDAVLCGGGVALIVVIGSRAPWWVACIAAGVALAIALDPLLMAIALVALVAALWTGTSARSRPDVLAASLGISFNVLARAELGGPLGVSAAIVLVVAALVFVLGIGRFPKVVRRVAWGGLVLLVVFAGAASALFGNAALRSRHDLAAGQSTAELGVVALEDGDFDKAADWFRQAADLLEAADSHLDEPWAKAAAVVPIVAQHQHAVTTMSHVGAAGAATVAEALGDIDLASIRPVDGRIDLDALAAISVPLTRVRDALDELQRTSAAAHSPWLVDRATAALDDFDESIAEHLPALDNSLQALAMAPALLGADSPRTYLMLFTTPAESRGLGGFVGSYAELTIDDGQLSLGRFGRSQDLDGLALQAGARVHDHEQFLTDYGRFGFDTDGAGAVGDAAFRNLAMTPEFPWVGEIGADLYEQATGRHVDGVIAMDPYVVATLLGYAGTVHVSSLDVDVTPESAAQFLLRDQYVLGAASDDQRADALAEAAGLAFDGLIGGGLPDPIALARDLGPLASERRLLVWSRDADEQTLLETVHIGGDMPPLEGADGWSFSLSNAGGNKIDSYLERKAGYESTTDPATGVTSGTMRIELTNTAPAEGLPDYVIGNRVGKPKGTSSLYVTLYSPLGLDGVTVDGTPTAVTVEQEAGWNAYRFFIDIPSGATARIEAKLSGTVEHPDADIVTWTQPMASDVQPLD